MLEKIEQLRKAPKKARERIVAVVTIVSVAIITLLWFLFFLSSFLHKNPTPVSSAPTTVSEQNQTETPSQNLIKPPFSQ